MKRSQEPWSDSDFRPDETGRIAYDEYHLSACVDENIGLFKALFHDDDTVSFRILMNNAARTRYGIIYIEGMVDAQVINLNLIKPLVQDDIGAAMVSIEDVESRLITCNEVKRHDSLEELVEAVLYGDTLLFMEGAREALVIGTKGFATRAIGEPDNEKALLGPREGFNEALMTNLSLLRRKLQTPDLKCSFVSVGTRSPTRLCLCYLDSLADQRVLSDLKGRLNGIQIDGVLDSNYIVECIQDHKWSPFKTVGTTEKPDTVAGRLLEGRIAIFVDGTPLVLTVPYLFIEGFQAADDYYQNFFFTNVGRFLRIIAFVLTVSVPALYIALVNYHQEMIPSPLMFTIAMTTEGVPFPTVIECFGMLIIFEVLRETGIRSSSKIGQALSIVGGLVVGQAAVEAKIVSAPMVIVVAMTGITGLIIPRLSGGVFIMRFFTLAMAAISGLLGFYFAWILMFIHLVSLQSFGYPYLREPFVSFRRGSLDSGIRAPIGMMKARPDFAKNRGRR